jgi:hypothetical protein
MEIKGVGQLGFDFLKQLPEPEESQPEIVEPSTLVRLGRPVDVQPLLSDDFKKANLGRRRVEDPTRFTSDYSHVIKKGDQTFWDLKQTPAWR